MKNISSMSRAALIVFTTSALMSTAVPSLAQSSMKTKEDGGGGIHLGGSHPKTRPLCSTQLNEGTTGPVAKAVWQVPAPGKINFCVLAGIQGNYSVAATGGVSGGKGSASTQRLATSGTASSALPALLPITVELRDQRGRWIWERAWALGQPYDEAPLDPDETKRVPHTALKFLTANLLEPQVPGTSVMLPKAWCVSDLNWARRPFLVVRLTGAGVRGHTDASEISCAVEFGAPELSNANLQTLIGATAFPTVTGSSSPSNAVPTKKLTQ